MTQASQFGGYGLTGGRGLADRSALLRQATWPRRVVPDPDPGGALLMVDAELGTKTVQRIVLMQKGEGPVLRTNPAELEAQAQALYRTGRARAADGLPCPQR